MYYFTDIIQIFRYVLPVAADVVLVSVRTSARVYFLPP